MRSRVENRGQKSLPATSVLSVLGRCRDPGGSNRVISHRLPRRRSLASSSRSTLVCGNENKEGWGGDAGPKNKKTQKKKNWIQMEAGHPRVSMLRDPPSQLEGLVGGLSQVPH